MLKLFDPNTPAWRCKGNKTFEDTKEDSLSNLFNEYSVNRDTCNKIHELLKTCPESNKVAVAIKKFISLNLLSNHFADSNLRYIGKLASIWCTDDDLTPFSQIIQKLSPESFDQMDFDFLVNETYRLKNLPKIQDNNDALRYYLAKSLKPVSGTLHSRHEHITQEQVERITQEQTNSPSPTS